MIELFVFGLALAIAVCVANYRSAFLICILAGLLQDPLRKVLPGEPVILSALGAGLFGIAFLGARARGLPMKLSALAFWGDASVRSALKMFVAVIVAMSLVTFVRTRNPFLAALGLVAYLAPLPALIGANQYYRSPADVRRYFQLYLMATIPLLAGVYLSYAGFTWTILDSVGYGLWVYGGDEGAVRLHSGFFRAPEVAAWHTGHVILLLIVDAVVFTRRGMKTALLGPLVLGVLGAMLMTGRRKFLGEIVVFLVIFGFLLYVVGHSPSRLTKAIAPVLLAGGLLTQLAIFKDAKQSSFAFFLQRGATTTEDVPERYAIFFGSIQYIFAQNTPFGSGAGIGSQGSQYLGLSDQFSIGAAAETGPGKVLAEIGIQGLFISLLLLYRVGRYCVRALRQMAASHDPVRVRLMCGLIAILLANAVVFFAAHQVYGDPFILLNLGWVAGFLIAIPRRDARAAGVEAAVRAPVGGGSGLASLGAR